MPLLVAHNGRAFHFPLFVQEVRQVGLDIFLQRPWCA